MKIGADGIEINDNGNKISIDEKGIRIDESSDDYRYDNKRPVNALDSLKLKLEREKQRTKDSLEKVKENIEKQLDKIDDNKNEPEAMGTFKLQSYLGLINIY